MKLHLSTTAKQTKQNIMNAFWELYTKQRIEQITVSGICQLAGYNRSTFYTYFEDVYQVLDEIEKQIVPPERFEKLIINNILNNTNKRDVIAQIMDFYEDNFKYFPVLLGEHGDPAFRKKLLKRLAPVVYSITISHPFTNDMKRLGYIMEYQSAAVLNTITAWYSNGKDIPVEEFLDLLIAITTNGVQHEILKLRSKH